MEKVLNDIRIERMRQELKWGEQNHKDGTGPQSYVLDYSHMKAEELATAARDQTNRYAEVGHVSYADIFLEEVFEAMAEEDQTNLREELVQVAAVAVAWVEKIDRERKQADGEK